VGIDYLRPIQPSPPKNLQDASENDLHALVTPDDMDRLVMLLKTPKFHQLFVCGINTNPDKFVEDIFRSYFQALKLKESATPESIKRVVQFATSFDVAIYELYQAKGLVAVKKSELAKKMINYLCTMIETSELKDRKELLEQIKSLAPEPETTGRPVASEISKELAQRIKAPPAEKRG